MGEKKHKLAAIVFTDIVGYTRQMEENEQRTMQLLQKQREIVFPIVSAFRGEIIKEMGDGLMMMFESAVDAVRCAIEIQKRLKDEEFSIRAGIHIGDVIFSDGDVFGSAVNTAARLEPLATPNGICISEDVWNQLSNKTDINTISKGKKALKGVKEPVEVFEILIEGVSEEPKKNLAYFFNDLWQRKVIHVLIAYILSAWIIKMAVAAIATKNMLSPYLVDLAWVLLLSLLPTVFLLSYFHGIRGKTRWSKPELVGMPLNVIFSVFLVVFLFRGKDLGATTTQLTLENEDGEKITRTVMKSEFRNKLGVFFFENKTGDTSLNWLQYGVTTALVYDISQDYLLETQSALSYMIKFKEAGYPDGLGTPLMLNKQIANYYHNIYFVSGFYSKTNEKWEVETSLYQVDNGKEVAKISLSNPDLFELIDDLSVAIKKELKISDQQIEETKDLPVKEIFTNSFPAFENYIKGLTSIYINNDWESGQKYSEKALEQDNDFVVAHLTIAEYYFNTNQPQKAMNSLQITMDKLYKLPERNQFSAKFFYYIVQQKADQANAVVKMWTELYPNDVTAHATLAQRYQINNEFEKVKHEYKTILQISPDNYNYIKALGSTYQSTGQYDSALIYFRRYAEIFPNDPKSYRNIGDSYQQLVDYTKARENFEKALLIDIGNAEIIYRLTMLDLKEGLYDDAKSRIDNSFKYCKTANDSIYLVEAHESYYENLGKIQLSFDTFKQKFELYARIVPPLRLMVLKTFMISKYIDAGRSDEALSMIKQIESEFQPPFDQVSAFGYLVFYAETEQAEKAKSYIAAARQLMEGFGERALEPNIFYAEGRIAETEKDYKKAIGKYEEFLNLVPGDSRGMRWLARSYREAGELKKAEKYILQILDREPGIPKNLYEAAMYYLAKGDKKKALEYIQKANLIWKDADAIYKPAQKAFELQSELSTV